MSVNTGNIFSALALSEYMAKSLPNDSSPHLRNPHDAIALLTHACMLTVGFRLVGLGEGHKISASSDSSDTKPLPKEWNASPSSDYAFRYAHSQSSLEYLIKISRLGSKAVINGLGIGDEKVYTLDLPIKDFISESSFPYTLSNEGGEKETALSLRQLFISAGRLTDAGSLLKLQIIQKLAPGLRKEGYEDSAHAASQHTQPREQDNPRAPGSDNPRGDLPARDPLRDDRLPPYAQPRPFNDPLAAEPRRPFPAGDFPPPGFEDEYDMNRPPGRGGIGAERRPLNIGEGDLYPPGLGPHDPLRGRGFESGGGGGMHPTFDDPLFGGRVGGVMDPRAPPGARYDPVGPGDGPPTLRAFRYISDIVEAPYTFEQLRTATAGHILRPLVRHLSDTCHHPHIVSALLILKWHFSSLEQDDRGVNEGRGYACELIAWRYLTHCTAIELIDYLLHEVPPSVCDTRNDGVAAVDDCASSDQNTGSEIDTESAMLLPKQSVLARKPRRLSPSATALEDDPLATFVGLNALEIATISDAKKFLRQRIVQKIINDIWHGEIVFWESLSVYSRKRPKVYNKGYVPVFLFLWIAAFAYEEFAEFQDAGTLFYAADFWSLWDIGIIGIGAAFLVARAVGLTKDSERIIDISFDILSIEALFLVPRVCSLLTLNPYFGTLMPCLKEMMKDFVKFLSIVVILFLGFLTTFTMLARGAYTAREVLWIMINDVASELNPLIGPPLMVIFVIMTNILLLTSLIAILSQSLTKVMEHAREEYLFQYSVFVLEASASRRLTYYFPPLVSVETQGLQRGANIKALKNLIPLLFFRPLRLCMSPEHMRSARIVLLKITHAPCIASIWLYEELARHLHGRSVGWGYISPAQKGTPTNHVKGKSDRSRFLVGQEGTKTSMPRTPTMPIHAAARASSAGVTQVDAALRGLQDALDAMGQKVDQLGKQIETSTASREELCARLRSTGEQLA
ncbi:MAG: hypothetical protein Q9217_003018 [Psora testacea]